jgi:MarC family membrane protein
MTFFSITVIFLILLDPLGNVPVFLAVLRGTPTEKHGKIIIRECIIAFVVLVLFLFFGTYIMQGLQITSSALGIAGGVILFLVALKMIFPPEHVVIDDKPVKEPFIVPLAIPMVAGPSAMAMVLLFSTQHPEKLGICFAALTAAFVITSIILYFANRLQFVLGERGLVAMERLMGMILTVMAVQMLLNGIASYFHLAAAAH